MDLDYQFSRFFIRHRDSDEPVKPARAKKRKVKNIRPVRGSNDPDVSPGIKSVHFRKELHQGSLDFTVSGSGRINSFCSYGIKLIDENDAGGFFFCHFEKVSYKPRSLANIFLYEF